MRIVLFIFSLICFAVGALVSLVAKGALQEIEAFIVFLMWAVFLCGGAIVDSIYVTGKSRPVTKDDQ